MTTLFDSSSRRDSKAAGLEGSKDVRPTDGTIGIDGGKDPGTWKVGEEGGGGLMISLGRGSEEGGRE